MAAQARGPDLRGAHRLVRVHGRAWASTEVRLTGGEPLVRRDLPDLVRRLARVPGVDDLSLTTNGVLLDRLAGPLADAGLRRLERLARLAVAHPLRRDHPPRRARPRPRRPRRRPARNRAATDQGQLRRHPRLLRRPRSPRWPSSRARKPFVVRFIEFMPLDADDRWDADQVLSGAEHPGHHRGALGARRRSPPGRPPPRDASASPTAPASSASSAPSPSRSARAATGSASPPTAGCAPACSRAPNGICRRRCATAPAMQSSRR